MSLFGFVTLRFCIFYIFRYDLKEAEAIAKTLSILEEITVSEHVKDGVEESKKKAEEIQSGIDRGFHLSFLTYNFFISLILIFEETD